MRNVGGNGEYNGEVQFEHGGEVGWQARRIRVQMVSRGGGDGCKNHRGHRRVNDFHAATIAKCNEVNYEFRVEIDVKCGSSGNPLVALLSP